MTTSKRLDGVKVIALNLRDLKRYFPTRFASAFHEEATAILKAHGLKRQDAELRVFLTSNGVTCARLTYRYHDIWSGQFPPQGDTTPTPAIVELFVAEEVDLQRGVYESGDTFARRCVAALSDTWAAD